MNRAFERGGRSFPPDTLDDFRLIDGVAEACQRLKVAGYLLIVVTNQPDVATGKQTRSIVDQMHQKLNKLLPLDDVFACFHTDDHDCECRKPKPGMLLDAARKHAVDLSSSFMVGDRWRDIEAGKNAGCKTLFIDYGYDEKRPTGYDKLISSLDEGAQYILSLNT